MKKKSRTLLAALFLGMALAVHGGFPLTGSFALSVQAEEAKAPVRVGFFSQDDGMTMQAFNDSAKDVLFRVNLFDGEGDGAGHYFMIAPVTVENMEPVSDATDETLLKERICKISDGSEVRLGEHEDEVAHYLTFTLPAGTSLETFLQFNLQPGKKLAIVPQQVDGFFYTDLGQPVIYAGGGEILSGASESEEGAGWKDDAGEDPASEVDEGSETENTQSGETAEGSFALGIGLLTMVTVTVILAGILLFVR